VADRAPIPARSPESASSGTHPRYARNPGTGEPLATASSLSLAEQAVHHDPGRPSAVPLPVVDAG